MDAELLWFHLMSSTESDVFFQLPDCSVFYDGTTIGNPRIIGSLFGVSLQCYPEVRFIYIERENKQGSIKS